MIKDETKMNTLTHADVMTDLNISLAGIADPDAEVPVMVNLAAQGDLLVRRVEDMENADDSVRLNFAGIPVVSGENRGGNAHIIHVRDEDTQAVFSRVTGDTHIEGHLEVVSGTAYLTHTEEHGSLAIPAGIYELRQRTERDRRVED